MKESEIINLIADADVRKAIIERRQIRKGGRPKSTSTGETARTSIYTSPAILAKIRVISATKKISIRQTISDALTQYVQRYERESGKIELIN